MSDDASPMVVLRYRGEVLAELLADENLLGALLDEAFAGPADVTRFGGIRGRGRPVGLDGVLPDNFARNIDVDCTNQAFVSLDQEGAVRVALGPGLCGMEHSQVAVEFGAEGVEIADERFIDDSPGAAEPGTVAIDHRASRGFPSGEPVEVVLTPVPDAEIAPRPDERVWEPLREFVCFDVTVHAGTAGSDGQVVPEVVVFDAGEQVVIPEPSGAAIYNAPTRVITQDPESAVVWSFGPIDMDEHRPDSITVTASQGEIVSWDASARHC